MEHGEYPNPKKGRTGLEKVATYQKVRVGKMKEHIEKTGPYARLKLDGPSRLPPLEKSKFVEVHLRKRKA
jgi:hypothetical protein